MAKSDNCGTKGEADFGIAPHFLGFLDPKSHVIWASRRGCDFIQSIYKREGAVGGLGLSLEIRPGQFIGSWWPAKFGDWVAKRDKLVGINARFDPPPRRAKTQARPARRATRAFSCLMPLLRRRRLSRFARRLGAGSVACPCAAASAPMSSRHCCSHCWSTSWAHPCLGAHAFAPCTRDPSAAVHRDRCTG